MSQGCGWATGAHMTELSTDWTGAHGTGALRVSGSGFSTEGADVLRAVRTYVVHGLTLEASYNGGVWWFGSVRDSDGVVAGSGLHNHLQSSRECNTSSAHSRSTSLGNRSPASLSRCSVAMILFPLGNRGCSSRASRERVGSSSQLGKGVNGGVSQGQRVGRGGVPCGSRGVEIGSSRLRYPILWFLQNLLHHLVTTIVSPPLLL